MKLQLFLFVVPSIVLAALPALAADPIPGPIAARIISVYDGDTMTVDALPWPGVTIRTAVRVDGVDTPEIHGKCPVEKALAIKARDFVRRTVGETVQLESVRLGKYAGRVVARVMTGGRDLAKMLIAEGLGRAYSGGRRKGWCS